jgi:hypothetical protein
LKVRKSSNNLRDKLSQKTSSHEHMKLPAETIILSFKKVMIDKRTFSKERYESERPVYFPTMAIRICNSWFKYINLRQNMATVAKYEN